MTMTTITSLLAIHLLLIIIVFVRKEIVCLQHFKEQPSYTEVNPGQDAILVCKVNEKRGGCHWQKDRKPVGLYRNKYEFVNGNDEDGDCSLRIRNAQLEFDDGLWECQVTASDFTTRDALSSRPATLVVRVAPQRPQITYNGTDIQPGRNLTVFHDQTINVTCVSRLGNPPSLLKWFLDDKELPVDDNLGNEWIIQPQINRTEDDNSRTWSAISRLQLTVRRQDHRRNLRCVSIHESYATRSMAIDSQLDVLYISEARLAGVPPYDIEENHDVVAVRCLVDANPRATIVWKRAGQVQPVSYSETLQFNPASRQNNGLYTCQARNVAGNAVPVDFHLDIKYPPKIRSIGNERLLTVQLYSNLTIECEADANPYPTYQWLQKVGTGRDDTNTLLVERASNGGSGRFMIANVTYEHQGEYVCRATNTIAGTERTDHSETVTIQVYGAPQILVANEFRLRTREMKFERGDDVRLQSIVCSDPRPHTISWQWGSVRLDAGSSMGRFAADSLRPDAAGRDDCYLLAFEIRSISTADARTYYLTVENDKGYDTHAIHIIVNEPLEMTTFATFLGALTLLLIPIVLCVLFQQRKRICCCCSSYYSSKTSGKSYRSSYDKKTMHKDGISNALTIESIYNTSTLGGVGGNGSSTLGIPITAAAAAAANGTLMKSPVVNHNRLLPTTLQRHLQQQQQQQHHRQFPSMSNLSHILSPHATQSSPPILDDFRTSSNNEAATAAMKTTKNCQKNTGSTEFLQMIKRKQLDLPEAVVMMTAAAAAAAGTEEKQLLSYRAAGGGTRRKFEKRRQIILPRIN